MLNIDRRAQRKLFFLCAFCFFTIIAFNFRATPLAAQAQLPTPPPYDPAAVPTPAQFPLSMLGARSFAENCAPCHGESGNSDGPTSASLSVQPPRFADPATIWGKSPAEYFHTAKFGRIQNMMPPWGNILSDEEIWQTVYFAWSLHTAQANVEAGRTLYSASCASCHGESGKGDGPDATVDLVNFSNSAAMIVQTQAELDAGWREAHGELGNDWSAEQRRDVLDLIRTFSYSPPWESALPAGDGVLTGLVQQGTADGDTITSTEVTLTGYVDFTPALTSTTTTDEQGRFTFTQLSLVSGVQYIVDAGYKGLNYRVFAPPLTPLTPTVQIDLPVYETTDLSDALHIQQTSLVLDFSPGRVLVWEIANLFNAGDRSYVGQKIEGMDGLATFEFILQPGAEQLNFQDGVLGGRYKQVGDKVYDTVAIAPGEKVAFITYELPAQDATITLNPQFAYPIGQLNLLVADLPGVQVTVPGLEQKEKQDIQGRSFLLWTGSPPQSGLQIKVDGILEADSTDPRTVAQSNEAANALSGGSVETNIAASHAAGLGTLLAVVLFGILFYSQRKQTGDPITAMQVERQNLIERIAELDDLHAISEVDGETWQQQRAQLKGRLLAITEGLRTKEGKK